MADGAQDKDDLGQAIEAMDEAWSVSHVEEAAELSALANSAAADPGSSAAAVLPRYRQIVST